VIAPHPGGQHRSQRRLPALAIACTLLTAGCASSSDGINAPLPRASRAQATAKARSMVDALAGAAGLRPGPPTSETAFSDCVGQNDEIAHDGRFELAYSVYVNVPQDQQTTVGQKIRTYMRRAKYADVSFHPFHTATAELMVRGYNGDWFIDIDTVLPGSGPATRIYISINSTCYLPPGVKQQKF
jgi:hypothetical protein